jgi:choline dehydrogenase-like flavoprotein
MVTNVNKKTEYDAIVIGSGFGGSLTAHALVHLGLSVLMLERGDWVKRGLHNWDPFATGVLTPFYTREIPYRVRAGGEKKIIGAYACVGGPSVFFGGVSVRFREADFRPDPYIVGDSNARWNVSYSDLEPYYTKAESILNVAGETGKDPTEPYRSGPYPQSLNGLSSTSRMIEKAAVGLGMSPFRLPLAINYSSNGNHQGECICCTTCDTFACAVNAKNDLATTVLPDLIKRGLDLKANTVAARLIIKKRRIVGVECYEKKTGEMRIYRAKEYILSAGTVASPHLILASNLQSLNPGGHVIGHYLMRHCSAFLFGVFPFKPNKDNEFQKQLCIQDYYFGHSTITSPRGKLGSIQQVQKPPMGLLQTFLPKPLGKILGLGVDFLTGLLAMAEDQPQYGNAVRINRSKVDRFGLPQLIITHHYSQRDFSARRALMEKAKKILKKAGAKFFYVHKTKTFSHAVGTVRMGDDPRTSALDSNCQFRGVENLFVVDGSFMPTSSGLNPSLTIAANALRVGEYISDKEK